MSPVYKKQTKKAIRYKFVFVKGSTALWLNSSWPLPSQPLPWWPSVSRIIGTCFKTPWNLNQVLTQSQRTGLVSGPGPTFLGPRHCSHLYPDDLPVKLSQWRHPFGWMCFSFRLKAEGWRGEAEVTQQAHRGGCSHSYLCDSRWCVEKKPSLHLQLWESPLLLFSLAGWMLASPPPAGAAPGLCRPSGSGSASVALLALELPHVWIPDKCLNMIVPVSMHLWSNGAITHIIVRRLGDLSLLCETKPRRQITCLTRWLHGCTIWPSGGAVGLESLGVEQQRTALLFPAGSRCEDVVWFLPGWQPEGTRFQWKLNPFFPNNWH